jgi:hypothetical protein
MGDRLHVLLQTFVLCACTNSAVLANSETVSDISYTASGNGYTMSDDSDKMADNSDKMADNSYKTSDDSYKMSDDSYKMSDDSYKMSDNSDKTSDNSDRTSDNSDKTSDNSYKTSSLEKNINFLGRSPLHRLYNCVGKDAGQSAEDCLTAQVAHLIDEMKHKERISLLDGIQLVRKEKSSGRSISGEKQMLQEEPLEASLQRDVDTHEAFLDNPMLHKLFNFFRTHSLEIGLPSYRTLRGTCKQIDICIQLNCKS